MGVSFKPDSLLEPERQRAREQSVATVAALMFVQAAEAEQFDDVTIAEHTTLFLAWDEHFRSDQRGVIRRDTGKDGVERLYKSIHPVLDASQNIRPSEDTTEQLWRVIGNPSDEWPLWSRPIAGVDNPYMKDDKCTDEGVHWISDVDDNWWKPGEYGWHRAED